MQKEPAPLSFILPMECLEVDQLPQGELWQYELKLDGYRTIAIKQNGEVDLFSRNGRSFNSKFPSIVKILEESRLKRFILDGEIVALDGQGRHSFALLQNIKTSKAPLRFYVFDLLHIDNAGLTKMILKKRRARLEKEFFALPEHVQLSPILSGEAHEVLANVKKFEFEGVVAKRLDSSYQPGETSRNWQKKKTQRSEDFLIGGYIPGSYGIEQLIVGEKRDGDFYFVVSPSFASTSAWLITDSLSKAGFSWGCVSAIDSRGRTIWIVDAHRDNGKRFIVRADDILTAFLELESAIHQFAVDAIQNAGEGEIKLDTLSRIK